MRQFKTGATRDNEEGKIDPEGFYSPTVFVLLPVGSTASMLPTLNQRSE